MQNKPSDGVGGTVDRPVGGFVMKDKKKEKMKLDLIQF